MRAGLRGGRDCGLEGGVHSSRCLEEGFRYVTVRGDIFCSGCGPEGCEFEPRGSPSFAVIFDTRENEEKEHRNTKPDQYGGLFHCDYAACSIFEEAAAGVVSPKVSILSTLFSFHLQ